MSIFCFIQDQVFGSISAITKQADVITSGVTSPLNGLVSQVSDGMWKGDGANRFVSEMTSEVIPMLGRLFTVNLSFADGLKKSADRMNQAFQQASSVANTLADVFGGIF